MNSTSVSSNHGEPGSSFTPLSRLCMVCPLPPFGVHIALTNPFFVKDTSAFLIIVYSAKHRGQMRASGVPSILDRIVEDATVHFLVIFTAHLLLILFQLFAPVSNFSANLCSSTHHNVRIGHVSTPPRKVSRPLEYCDKDVSDQVPSRIQRDCSVSRISHQTMYPRTDHTLG